MKSSWVFLIGVIGLLSACSKEPKGMEPARFCTMMRDINPQVDSTCEPAQVRVRENEPEHYACRSLALEEAWMAGKSLSLFKEKSAKCDLLLKKK